MERPDIEKESPEVVSYIDYLENRVNGAAKLSKEISLLKSGVAHDLELIRNGEEGENYEHLKYVCLDKLSPRYNLIKVLMSNIKSVEDDVIAISTIRSKTTKEVEEPETLPIAGEITPQGPVVNMFEEMSKRIVSKNATR